MNKETFRPRQSLGQNFLVDENVARKIIRTLTPNPQDVIIEIGAGFGVLTKYLIPQVRRIVAVEIDRDLCHNLNSEFGEFDNFALVGRDFLKLDLLDYLEEGSRLRILGNIPYHITSPVVFKVFGLRRVIHDMTLMIQREVAGRIVAHPRCKAYGILSVFSQLYSRPEILFHVSKHVFRPKPDVDSTVVRWDFTRAPDSEVHDEELLDEIVHLAFQQRRKMLRRSLQQLPGFMEVACQFDFDLEKRPEELSVAEFVELSNQIAVLWKNAI
ncbi:MAG: 16S rRNA (adenine(1518)-N(6)/adenine(1519)-N(6))-dimethyltransferase RsmA [bacterium]